MDLTVEKSQEQADIIEAIKPLLWCLDTEYCKVLAKNIIDQARFQDTLSVLNPNYPISKNRLLEKQAEALQLLVEYVETLKACDDLKTRVAKEEAVQLGIAKLFV